MVDNTLRTSAVAAGAVLLLAVAAGCGSSSSSSSSSGSASGSGSSSASGSTQQANAPEVSPSGDISDSQVYVLYHPPGGGYAVKVPEGWSRSASGGAVTFTDKLNSVRMETAGAAPQTVSAVKTSELPKLAHSVPGFTAQGVTTVHRSAGTAIRIKYLADSKPNQVTGKSIRDAVERYVFTHNGKTVVLTLSGPKGADNVDPWRIVTNSLRFTP
jgi:hypothetical protein